MPKLIGIDLTQINKLDEGFKDGTRMDFNDGRESELLWGKPRRQEVTNPSVYFFPFKRFLGDSFVSANKFKVNLHKR